MSELKKIDFRDFEAPSASQPSVSEEVKKGHSLRFLDEAFSRMSHKTKVEVGALVVIVLLAIGFVVLHFLD